MSTKLSRQMFSPIFSQTETKFRTFIIIFYSIEYWHKKCSLCQIDSRNWRDLSTMSLRLRPHVFFVLTTLLIALLIGPPLSIAKNLPTVCNIFDKKMAGKAGPCGHRALSSKIQDKSFEVEAVLFLTAELEFSHSLVIPNNPTSLSFPFGGSAQSNPLRCWFFSPFRDVSPYSFQIFLKFHFKKSLSCALPA